MKVDDKNKNKKYIKQLKFTKIYKNTTSFTIFLTFAKGVWAKEFITVRNFLPVTGLEFIILQWAAVLHIYFYDAKPAPKLTTSSIFAIIEPLQISKTVYRTR